MTKSYFAFVGSNATTGNANIRTGRFNKWGKMYHFNSKKDRDDFCDTYNNQLNAIQ